MRRTTTVVLSVFVAAAVTAVISRPSVVNALAGLAGRTHVIVTEENLKTLSASIIFTPTSTVTTSLHERNRDGSLGDTYTVPAGKVFVLTDARVEAVPGQNNTIEFFTRLSGPGGDRWLFHWDTQNVLDIVERHFTGGLPYDAGSTVDFTTFSDTQFGSFALRFDVLGYETEDRP